MFGLLGTVVVASIVVAALAVSGAFSKSADKDGGPSTPPPPPAQPTTPPPPPPPSPPGGPASPSVLASVARTCGADGHADCFVSLRSGPSSRTAEKGRLDNGVAVRVVCQRRGERAYSSVLRHSSTVWARTDHGRYLANVYLKGEGLDPYKITLPVCK